MGCFFKKPLVCLVHPHYGITLSVTGFNRKYLEKLCYLCYCSW